jgi:hypothetical protein
MPETSDRIRGFGESVIRRMTRIANQGSSQKTENKAR